MTDMFLSKEDLSVLTGRKIKSKQLEALRKMGLPFWVNAIGCPVVPRPAVEGRKEATEPSPEPWAPRVLKDK